MLLKKCLAFGVVVAVVARDRGVFEATDNSKDVLGNETVFNEADYIRVSGGEIFFWVFESRNKPATDPLIMWLSGGPGCSSIMALYSENGPYAIKDGEPVLNPYSWNSNATAIWVDQPLGTGFSRGVPVHNEDQVAQDMGEFLTKFFERYLKYKDLPFYIIGESYAGHYVPAIASKLLNFGINLQGAAIGNGLTDPAIQYQYYVPFVEEHDLVSKPVLKFMQGTEKLCLPLVQACEHDDDDDRIGTWTECFNAYLVCNLGLVTPIQASGLNVYDVRKQCGDSPLCYDFSEIDDYLNRDDVQAALGVQKKWKECNKLVDLVMVYGGDWMKSYAANVKMLLDAGKSVLIYAGEYDFICNWMGNHAWTLSLDWDGQAGFTAATNTSFLVDGVDKGSFISANNFTFLKLKDAGHLAPMDQPESTLEMVKRFTLGTGFS